VPLFKLLKKYPIKFGLNFSNHRWNKEGTTLPSIVANLSRIEIKNYGGEGGINTKCQK
jgi:hypothetical protein